MSDVDATLLVRLRDGAIEAEHRGSLVAIDRHGQIALQVGAFDRLVLPRSSVKMFHALPLLITGAASRFGLENHQIALAASSHAAEPEHIQAVSEWAERLRLGEHDLACGPDWPLGGRPGRGGVKPTAFHNNNAGKHLAVLTTCMHLGEDVSAYCAPDHPAQKRLIHMVQHLCDVPEPSLTQVDQCGMRTFALPLLALARGAARMACPEGLDHALRDAVCQLHSSIAQNPFYFAGKNRLASEIVRITSGRIIAKGGSEGIFVALDRAHGIGIALKIADGSSEAASAVLIESLVALNALRQDESVALRTRVQRVFAHPYAPERRQVLTFPWYN